VDGAASYRLSVLGPDAPRWGWLGTDTTVRYGGVPEGTDGPSLVAGSWWSVAALAGDGSIIAISDLRSVSPGSDPGPAPSWTKALPAASPAAGPTGAPAHPVGARTCDLLTVDEIHGAIKGTWGQPSLDVYPSGTTSRCEWTSVNGSRFALTILAASTYDPAGWNADGTVPDLGEKAFKVSHGLDRRIGFLHGDYSVTLTIDYLKVDFEGFAALARIAEDRLP
jgi:hypothetical protein